MNAPVNQSEATALATIDPRRTLNGRDLILQPDNLNAMVRVADLMANSKKMVPAHLRSNPGGCLALTMQAMRWNMDPFALALKTFEVNDLIGYEAQAIISALNNSPLLTTRIKWRWEGQWEKIVGKFKMVESRTKKDDNGQPKKYIVPAWDFDKDEEGLQVTCYATLAGDTEPTELTLMMKQARTRNSPLWTEDPKQQLAYLAAKRWGRLHAPDVIMGVYTPDELEEVEPKHMGMVDEVKPPPAPNEWPAELFAERLPEWRKAIAAKRASADSVVAKAKTKYPLSAAQEAEIRKPDATDVTAKPVDDDGVVTMTYAQVADKLNGAKTADDLDTAASLITAVSDKGQQGELSAIYETRKTAFTA